MVSTWRFLAYKYKATSQLIIFLFHTYNRMPRNKGKERLVPLPVEAVPARSFFKVNSEAAARETKKHKVAFSNNKKPGSGSATQKRG